MTNFITNDINKDMKKRLVELAESSKELKFLVGFFYFSGIRELYQGIKNNQETVIKILVGLNIDKSNFRLLEFADEFELSEKEIIDSYLGDIKTSLTLDDFDTKEFYEQVKFFIGLINTNKLIIRKTFNPNHAKLYFFHLPGQITRKKVFITGSSNLTRIALTTQAEFNVEISDFGIVEAEKYFDDLWDDAVKITEDDTVKTKLKSIIENDTLIKEITPYEAYLLTMKTYLDSYEQKEIGQSIVDLLLKNGFKKFEYQLDAIKQGLAIIEKHNGVIIADVVGLGKSIIASCIAKSLKKRGIVICPPGLMGDKNKTSGWTRYLEQFQLHDWIVRSSGDLESTAEFVNQTNDIEVIIVDEVHRFRNQDTKDYENLRNICRGKIVILLTATPFNNKPADILSLLKLFINSKQSSITLDSDLTSMFRTYKGVFERLSYIRKYHNSTDPEKRRKAKSYYQALFGEGEIDLSKVKQRSAYLASQLRDIIEPVTIRRNRLDLKNNPYYQEEVKELSVIADPIELFFELTPEQSLFYDKILKDYFGESGQFKGAIYQPFIYEKVVDQDDLDEVGNFELIQQRQLYEFMCRLMVKRFESSFGAFTQSIKRFKSINEDALTFINKTNKYILNRPLLERIFSKDEETIEDELAGFAKKLLEGDYPKNNRIYNVEEFTFKDGFLADIQSDIDLFEKIHQEMIEMDLIKDDPKAECLIKHVEQTIQAKPNPGEPQRKVIIFSEYLDTVKHLSESLISKFGERVLVQDGNLTTHKIKEINQEFDAMDSHPTNHYDILLSTDKLSEGFNLNRAGTIINYDIPWNPVRVIQRVGRINRISKKVFDELYIVNFFPTEKGATQVKTKEIASNKMFMIHEILGEDSKIFEIDETPTPAGLYKRITQNPDESEVESFYTKVLKLYLNAEKEHPEITERIKNYPAKVKVAKAGTDDELLVFFKKGRLFVQGLWYNRADNNKPYATTFEEVFSRIVCSTSEPKLNLSSHFWGNYEQVKMFRESFREIAGAKSLESRATNNLKTIIKNPWDELMPRLPFLRKLLNDIQNYGSLSDYTLRRISNLAPTNPRKHHSDLEEIDQLTRDLGVDYLSTEQFRNTSPKKEIIIALENRTYE